MEEEGEEEEEEEEMSGEAKSELDKEVEEEEELKHEDDYDELASAAEAAATAFKVEGNQEEVDITKLTQELNQTTTNSIPKQSQPPTLLCQVCNKLFDNLHRLQRHMMCHDMSPELRKFKCDFCNKAFKFKHHLKVNNMINTKKKKDTFFLFL